MASPTERAQMQLAQALSRCDDPVAREHIRAARDELTAPPELVACRECGRVGLPARMVCSHCAD